MVRVETSIEPDRVIPVRSDTSKFKHQDPVHAERNYFDAPRKPALSYAVVAMRPSMIRWLNRAQNFLFVLQWMQSLVFGIKNNEKNDLVEIPGFNNFRAKTNDMRIIGAVATTYFNGFFSPKVIGAFIVPDSAFISADFAFRFGDVWRMNVTVTDFFGADPYANVGLFRDRDEINLALTAQF